MKHDIWRPVKDSTVKLTIASTILILVFGTSSAYASTSSNQSTFCVLQPIDQSIPTHMVNMTMKVLGQHNETARYVGLVAELTNRTNPGCDYVIQFQRMVNSNDQWTDKNSHYTISGNTLTLYTNTTPINQPDSIGDAGTAVGGHQYSWTYSVGGVSHTGHGSNAGDVIAPVMTNWACLGEALATYHFQSITGYAGFETCDPWVGTVTTSDEVPSYVVHKSLELALAQMHL